MKWYYRIKGNHVHVKVFTNGKLNGTLIFGAEEFNEQFINNNETEFELIENN